MRLSVQFIFFMTSIFGSIAQASSLTPAQHQMVLNTLQSEALALTVARAVDPKMIPAKPTPDSLGKTYDQLLTALQAAIKSGACVADAGSVGVGPKGNGCNWSYTEMISNSAAGVVPATSTRMATYTTSDPFTVSLNDVTGVNGLAVTTTTNAVNGTSFSGSGDIISQTLGSIPVTVQGEGSFGPDLTGTIRVEMDLTFPGFTAAFVTQEVTVPGGVKTVYTLNGDILAPSEVSAIEMPDLQPTSKTPPPPGPINPTNPFIFY